MYCYQVSRCFIGSYEARTEHSKECCIKGECIHDDCLYSIENPFVPCW